MAYTKQTWVDGAPGTTNGTANAARLGYIENGIEAAAAAADLKAPIASPTFTGTVGGVTKTHVGLGSVDNTADSAKPVSTAQAAAIAVVDSAAVHKTGAETLAGVKTFSSIPVVPDSSFVVAKISATGTRSANTFLRGDGTFATPASASVVVDPVSTTGLADGTLIAYTT